MDQTCAITDAGALYCWGNNDPTETDLGVGSPDAAVLTPSPVTNMESGVTAVDVGKGVICAIKSSSLYCWGSNPAGELGWDSFGSPVTTPTLVTGLEDGVTAVMVSDWSRSTASKNSSICAIRAGALWCLGENDLHQLGMGSNTFVGTATAHPDLTSGVSSAVITGAGGCIRERSSAGVNT